MSSTRTARRLLVALFITSGIFLITYATRAAYDEMYSSLIPKNGTSLATSANDGRKMALVSAATVIDARSTKKAKLGGREITVICVAGVLATIGFISMCAQSCCIPMKRRWLERRRRLGLNPRPRRCQSILGIFRPMPEEHVPSPVIVNLADIMHLLQAHQPYQAHHFMEPLDGEAHQPTQDSPPRGRRLSRGSHINKEASSTVGIQDVETPDIGATDSQTEPTSDAMNNPTQPTVPEAENATEAENTTEAEIVSEAEHTSEAENATEAENANVENSPA